MPSLTLDWLHVIILLGAIQGVFLTVALALPVYLMSGPDKIAWYHRLLAGDALSGPIDGFARIMHYTDRSVS